MVVLNVFLFYFLLLNNSTFFLLSVSPKYLYFKGTYENVPYGPQSLNSSNSRGNTTSTVIMSPCPGMSLWYFLHNLIIYNLFVMIYDVPLSGLYEPGSVLETSDTFR